jgi:hypothetical protein
VAAVAGGRGGDGGARGPASVARIESGMTEPSLTTLVTISKPSVPTSALIERAELDSIGEDSSRAS